MASRRKISGLRFERSSAVRSLQQLEEDCGSGASEMAPDTSPCTMGPDSRLRPFWDLGSILVMLYDSLVLPYLIAWDPPRSATITGISWFTLCFWTTDMILNFLTGYYKDGELVLRFALIAQNYLRSWFWIDLLIVGSDWMGIIFDLVAGGETSDDSEGDARFQIMRLVRISRMMRLVGMMRLVRIFRRFQNLGKTTLTTGGSIVVQVLKLLAIILWLNHMFTCIWYGIGRLGGDTGHSWLDVVSGVDDDGVQLTYRDAGFPYQYTTAMHWSMTQMTPGSMQVFPVNSLERSLNIFCLVFGLLFGTSLISRISAAMVQFNMTRQEAATQTSKLRRFLLENNIKSRLSMRIQKQIWERMRVQARLTEKDLPSLTLLSSKMLVELRIEAFTPHVSKHPLFNAWGHVDPLAMNDLCSLRAIEFVSLAPGEDLFTPHTDATHAYLVLRGNMSYSYVNEYEKVVQIPSGTWLCEVALWTNWTHRGTLEAVSTCELISLNCQGVMTTLKHRPLLAPITNDWCAGFACTLRSESSHLPTLEVNSEHALVIMTMNDETRSFLGHTALKLLTGQLGHMGSLIPLVTGMQELEEEVEAGKCVLLIDGTGALLRTVCVVVLRITRQHDRHIFVQIAELTSQEEGFGHKGWVPAIALPGTKLKAGDRARPVAMKLLEAELSPVAHAVRSTLSAPRCVTEIKESATYGVTTKYLRIVYLATIDDAETELQSCLLAKGVSMDEPGCGSPRAHKALTQRVRRSSSNLGSLKMNMFDEFQVYQLRDPNGERFLYSWVAESMFNELHKGEHNDALKRWLTMVPTADIVQNVPGIPCGHVHSGQSGQGKRRGSPELAPFD